jgi:Ca2+-binding EF-hand superfamily protein
MSVTSVTPPDYRFSTETTQDRLLRSLDQNGDGTVRKDDFVRAALDQLRETDAVYKNPKANGVRLARHEAALAKKFSQMFDRADRNRDGAIDAGEMSTSLMLHSRLPGGPSSARQWSVASVALAMQQYQSAQQVS